jgi:hypothetical protein
MTEAEPAIRDLGGNLLPRPQGEKAVLLPLLFDQPEGKAGGVSLDELAHEGSIDG